MQAFFYLTLLASFVTIVLATELYYEAADTSTNSQRSPTHHTLHLWSNTTAHLTLANITDISNTTRFLLLQVSSQFTILNLTRTQPSVQHVAGSSVGMVQMVEGSNPADSPVWTVNVEAGSVREKDYPVPVLVVFQQYENYVPIPGGCNQVFSLPLDPNVRVSAQQYDSQVWFQWAQVGTAPGDTSPSCEAPEDLGRLQYDVYVSHYGQVDNDINDLFDVIIGTTSNNMGSAQKIATLKDNGNDKSLVTVSSERGQGSVYSVVVTDTKLGLSAHYVSAVSHACNYTAGDCDLTYDAVEWVMMVVSGAVGFLLLVLGHGFIKTEMALMGFIGGALVSFIGLSTWSGLSDPVRLGISTGLGIVGGMIWLAVWMTFTFPSVSVLLPGLCGGFLVSGSLFLTPFANISWWATSVNYGLVFTCVTLLFAVLMLCSPRTLNIVSCCLIGGYCVTMAVAIPLRSSLRLIVLNVVRHAAVSGYFTVIIVSPFSTIDIGLTVMWAALLAAGMGWQFYRSRGKPHFPVKRRRLRHRQPPHQDTDSGHAHTVPASHIDEERAPLLGNQDPPLSYDAAVSFPANRSGPVSRPM